MDYSAEGQGQHINKQLPVDCEKVQFLIQVLDTYVRVGVVMRQLCLEKGDAGSYLEDAFFIEERSGKS